MNLIIVTACLAGVAHSKMCANALKKEAEARGHRVLVEMQGGTNLSDTIPAEVCKKADIVLIAYAISIAKKERFEGLPIIKVPIDQAIRNIKAVIDEVERVYITKKDKSHEHTGE